ncbi:hypothetical protein GOB57_09190 [Sinorhizobium meliloti]|nr:hypothetical protein [Sinorhizobium meliloti]
MTWYTIRYDRISAFKTSWPAHGLPADFDSLSVETDASGDVVDIEAYVDLPDGGSAPIEWREFDGPALKALVDDCVEYGDIADPAQPPAPPSAAAPLRL